MSTIKDFVTTMKTASDEKTKAYDTTATVTRIEGNTAWVHIPGGVNETPAKMTINASAGETVQVRVADGRAFLVGNASAPPTDDSTAVQAVFTATNAQQEAIKAFQSAESARQDAAIAHEAANNALEDAGIARQSAEQAAMDAETAAQAATNAEASASLAEASATEAQGNAETASRAAQLAAQDASDAKASAQSAQASASSAGENASRAQAASEAAQLAALSSITTDTIHYLATSQGSGVTRQTSGWTTTVQTMTATDKYLWTYHTYTTAGGTPSYTEPVITGTYGEQGNSVTVSSIAYAVTTTDSQPQSFPYSTVPTVPEGSWLWTKTTYSDGTSAITKAKQGVSGTDGADGTDGVSVTAVQPQYYLSTSDASATGGSWSTSLTYVAGKFIWTRDQITYSNNTTGFSTAIYNEALTQSCKDAAEALGLIEEQQEYFWHDSLGAHVLSDKDTVSGTRYRTDIKGAGLEVFELDGQNDISVAKFGGDGVRVGKESGGHTTIASSGMKIYGSNGAVELANLGYGSGNSSGGTANAPYYTLGTRTSTADAYSSSSTYYVGDTCTYNSTLYVCISDITTAESWTSSHWKRVIGNYSAVEGNDLVAAGAYSTASGAHARAIGDWSHAEGEYAVALGHRSHAEGGGSSSYRFATVSEGVTSHAEGSETRSIGQYSHAEGRGTSSVGQYSHAEGWGSKANGDGSHAGGTYTIANGNNQTVIGKYNTSDSTSLFIIGNGTAVNARSNAFKIDSTGDIYPQNTKMVDFVTDQGTSGIWTYRKWNSGIAECWGWQTKTVSDSYANFYITFPTGLFNANPNAVCSVGATGEGNIQMGYVNATATYIDSWVYRSYSTSNSVWVYARADGRWK